MCAEAMNEIDKGQGTAERIIDRAIGEFRRLGADIGEIELIETALMESERVSGQINDLDFFIDLDLAYDGDTTLHFSLQVLPEQAISEPDAINTVFGKLEEELRSIIPAPAVVQRGYGYTPDESQNDFPDFPSRPPVGTSFSIRFLLGWDDPPDDFTSKWNDISGENTVWQDFEGIVPKKLARPLDVAVVINDALQFMDTAQLRIASQKFDKEP
jgi:hypothetical protein